MILGVALFDLILDEERDTVSYLNDHHSLPDPPFISFSLSLFILHSLPLLFLHFVLPPSQGAEDSEEMEASLLVVLEECYEPAPVVDIVHPALEGEVEPTRLSVLTVTSSDIDNFAGKQS